MFVNVRNLKTNNFKWFWTTRSGNEIMTTMKHNMTVIVGCNKWKTDTPLDRSIFETSKTKQLLRSYYVKDKNERTSEYIFLQEGVTVRIDAIGFFIRKKQNSTSHDVDVVNVLKQVKKKFIFSDVSTIAIVCSWRYSRVRKSTPSNTSSVSISICSKFDKNHLRNKRRKRFNLENYREWIINFQLS